MKKAALWIAWGLVVISLLVAPTIVYADGDDDDDGGEEEGIVTALAELGKKIVDIIIGIAAILVAVGIAAKMAQGEFSVAVGNPYGLSRAWTGVAGIVVAFIVAALSILVANTTIDLITPHIPGGGIHIP